jgi:2-iminoacetate synthase
MSIVNNIINEKEIFNALKKAQKPSRSKIGKILDMAIEKTGLNLEEVGCLANTEDPELIKEMFKAAGRIKEEIYGERLVFFAPLYVSSFCVNDCDYCGFHCRNKAPRKKLTFKEVKEQVEFLEDMGHKRLLLEFGEDPVNNPIDYVVDVIKTIYNTKKKGGEIRRVNVNIAATSVEDYQKLKQAGIGTYQLFQETYHRPTYQKLHCGPKADYDRQITAHNRAFEAGIDDIGLGTLFGLYDWQFEVLSLVTHAQYLDRQYGVGPHTISVPRFQPAETVNWPKAPYEVKDEDFLKIIAILRLAVPYTGIIMSTRERPEIRAQAFRIGISQTSAASCASPGGYGKKESMAQFNLYDHRTLDEVILSILKQNLLPSFCTACYRSNRTGQAFMEIVKPGNIHNFCRPNGILTFVEYLEDYASPAVKKLGIKVIKHYLEKIPSKEILNQTKKRLGRIKNGERDIYF